MAHKPKLINTLALLFMCVFTTVTLTQFAYQNRCRIIKCSPASWQKILDLVFAKSGKDFRFEAINAHPSSWSSFTETGPTAVDINVMYVSLNPDRSQRDEAAGKIAPYPIKFLQFDDQNMTTKVSTGNGWAGDVPPEDRQEKLRRVTVHPRDAFRITWVLAKEESDLSLDEVGALANLFFDTQGVESAWKVAYVYNKTVLTFYVDAQTGQVISMKKE